MSKKKEITMHYEELLEIISEKHRLEDFTPCFCRTNFDGHTGSARGRAVTFASLNEIADPETSLFFDKKDFCRKKYHAGECVNF